MLLLGLSYCLLISPHPINSHVIVQLWASEVCRSVNNVHFVCCQIFIFLYELQLRNTATAINHISFNMPYLLNKANENR